MCSSDLSDLTEQVSFAGGVLKASADVTPAVPLRLISISGASAYSAIQKRLLPFEISSGVLDHVRAEVVAEPSLSIVDPRDPKAASQLGHGIYPDGWMGPEGTLLLKIPSGSQSVRAEFFIPPSAPGRTVSLSLDGKIVTQETYKIGRAHV